MHIEGLCRNMILEHQIIATKTENSLETDTGYGVIKLNFNSFIAVPHFVVCVSVN